MEPVTAEDDALQLEDETADPDYGEDGDIFIPSIDLGPLSDSIRLSHLMKRNTVDIRRPVQCVFVVHFDTKLGNKIEWSIGMSGQAHGNCFDAEAVGTDGTHGSLDELEGVEFKAMPSGIHILQEDFVLFRTPTLFGIAVFHRMNVDSAAERCARMRSVGVLTSDYHLLPQYANMLHECAAELNAQGERATDFSRLASFYEQQMHAPERPLGGTGPMAVSSTGNTYHLLHFYNANLFTLWKALILRMRILFFTPVPVGTVCESIYSLCRLAQCTTEFHNELTKPVAVFFVNVADIDRISKMQSFVACTTEAIFREKPDLYDVFVDNQTVVINNPEILAALKLTKGDLYRHACLRQNLLQPETPSISKSTAIFNPPAQGATTSGGRFRRNRGAQAPATRTATEAAAALERRAGGASAKASGGSSVSSRSAPPPSRPKSVVDFNRQRKVCEQLIQDGFKALNDFMFESLQRASRDGRIVSKNELADFGLHPSDHAFLRRLVQLYQLRVQFMISRCLPMLSSAR